jgi:hypothetical protein
MDKFYTKTEIARKCCIVYKKYIDIDYNNDLIIEPSAGNGVFVQYINNMCKNTIFLDIMPENDTIVQQDYLSFDYTILKKYKNSCNWKSTIWKSIINCNTIF